MILFIYKYDWLINLKSLDSTCKLGVDMAHHEVFWALHGSERYTEFQLEKWPSGVRRAGGSLFNISHNRVTGTRDNNQYAK